MKKQEQDLNIDQVKVAMSNYLKGNCTDKERALIEQWYNSQASGANFDSNKIDFEIVKDDLWERIESQQKIRLNFWQNYRLVGIAASIILIVAFAAALFGPVLFKNNVKQEWVNVLAPKGHVLKILLKDGSKVWLNGGTKFAYVANFDNSIRLVKLIDGEAYFDVAHKEHTPFIVMTRNLKTQVLGTSFNISSFSVTKKIRVTVLSGKVAVNKVGVTPVFLLPDEQAEFNIETNKLDKLATNSKNSISWVTGIFSFHDEELETITEAIGRRFNVKIIFAPEGLKKLKFTTGFNINDNLSDVLDDLKNAGKIKYKINKNEITISSTSNN